MISFSASTLETSTSLKTIIDWVKAGIIHYEKGEYDVPTRMHLEQPGLTYLLMPAIGPEYFCTAGCRHISNIPWECAIDIGSSINLAVVIVGTLIGRWSII